MPPDPRAPIPPRSGRVHEVCGPSATGFAAICCAMTGGPVLWIREGRRDEMPYPEGLAGIFDPSRLLIALSRSQTDTLAVAEEALRDGAAPLVVIEVTEALDLREGRRLRLAAGVGGTTGLCLIPEGMGSNAAETRWRCASVFDPGEAPDSTLMRWEIIKNKTGTLGVWHVRWDRAAHRLDMVSPAGFGPGRADAAG